MKKIIFIFSILAVQLLYGQGSLNNLELLNGYKDFKFYKTPTQLSSFTLFPASIHDSPNIKDYYCTSCTGDYLKFGCEFSSLFVAFYKSQLYEISLQKKLSYDEFISQLKLSQVGLLDDFQLLGNKLKEMFGDATTGEPYADNSGAKMTWSAKTITLVWEWYVTASALDGGKKVVYISVKIRKNALYNEAVLSGYK